jgi:GH25 family lysozyme M1 (1,4-beta-N-acetylmuramidase)
LTPLSRRRPWLRCATTLTAVLGALTLGVAGTATAAPASGSVTHAYHPWADFMGSTVAAHEGGAAPSGGAVAPMVSGLPGDDVSTSQGTVDWTSVKNAGAKFAYIKATEGTGYRDPSFNSNYPNAYYAGLVRGAYHFARPDLSSGATQADYFADHGGAWSADGKTLPGAVDIEYNPYGAECYGLGQSAMTSWLHSFVNEYHSRTGRWAVIYTTFDWWRTCTGNTDATFATNDPLWITRWSTTVGTLPYGWSFYTFWQWAPSGALPGDQDVFNGDASRLTALANNT